MRSYHTELLESRVLLSAQPGLAANLLADTDRNGVIDAREGRMAEAIHAFRRSLALQPDLDDARRNLVTVRWALEQRAGAVAVGRVGLGGGARSGERGGG